MRIQTRSLLRQINQDRKALALRDDVLDPVAVAEQVWKELDTPLSLGLWLLVKNGQLEDALRVKFNPGRYLDFEVTRARDDYQSLAFLAKCPLEMKGVDRESLAWEKFQACEEQCRLTNARFRHLRDRPSDSIGRVEAVLHSAQRKISRWLGTLDVRSWALRCRFGPGVDLLHKGLNATAYHKLERQSVTADFYSGAQGLICDHPGWFRYIHKAVTPTGVIQPNLVTVPGNKVTFVPKTALIDRSIAVEPGMNIFAQLGLGALIRARLKKAGLDLDDADPNRGLALEGSRFGTVATVDLSSASDTLAREVVRELLPEPWFLALDWVRSKVGSYTRDGVTTSFRYEKFSSMGNGYTFELESMIFYALALACTEVQFAMNPSAAGGEISTHLVRAYGDDITAPTWVVPLLEEVLKYCGFTLNTDKTYTSGVFRESCGMDFFNGVNVRPYYLKESKFGSVESLYRLANGLRRVAHRRNNYFGCDSGLRPAWRYVVKRIPASLRRLASPPVAVLYRDKRLAQFQEYELGDMALSVNLDEAMSSPLVVPARDYHRGWLYTGLTSEARSYRAESFEALICFGLYAFRDGAAADVKRTPDEIPIRGGQRRRLTRGLYTPVWPDLGPWL